jgi:hypothetical protein
MDAELPRSPDEPPEYRGAASDIKISAVATCGEPCFCADYTPAPGLTAEALYERVLRDLAPARRRFASHGKNGEAALAHHENLIWKRLVGALSLDGRAGLVNEKCIWRYARQTLWSGRKDVRAGRWSTGVRSDCRPERREARTRPHTPPGSNNSALQREFPMDPELLMRMHGAACDPHSVDDVVDAVVSRANLQALLNVVRGLQNVSREAIEHEFYRQQLIDPLPLTSTQRGRHRRAQERACEGILSDPDLEMYHALARRVLDQLRAQPA